ncbi:hypothetical protein D051_4105 [Vibrio parahaemolyticus VPCR-2010]|nr:hypothetical protein [Vibrio parahaemolyticus]EQM49657.1 hypothetical protein D051_4105 [Vibrio parahaemolyticus VPCR-2010]EGQ9623201.1 hypothetical protein [Vibrio parahaemolyticus]EGR2350970.1 hypothetical protein [Vibrio parahaemolyticus]EGR2982567.1 hypothetical protein [Vibrio parahaemolyticus]
MYADKTLKLETQNQAKNTLAIRPKHPVLATFFSLATNAQLRGEQRLQPNLTHCAINTKFEVEAKMPSVVNPS